MLRQQLVDAAARAEELVAENARLSASATAAIPEPPSRELLRLRGEAGRLRVAEREAQQVRLTEMQAAQAKLTNAEVELARMMKLYSEKVVTVADLNRARHNVEVLKAEAKGDAAEVARVRLREAEEELALATELRKRGVMSHAEYEEAVRKLELLRGGNR